MQEQPKDKSKLTLYFSQDLHDRLKIRAALEGTPMSEIAAKAVAFYLSHSEIVEAQGIGRTHQIHYCPECTHALVLKGGELISVSNIVGNTSVGNAKTRTLVVSPSQASTSGDEELVTC